MNNPFVSEFLSRLTPNEKDYLSGIASEALQLMQAERTPESDDRIHAICMILTPMLEAMARDRAITKTITDGET